MTFRLQPERHLNRNLRFDSSPLYNNCLHAEHGALTPHYSQSPLGKVPIGAGVCLVYHGKTIVYNEWTSEACWGGADIEDLME
jgi:hypothetical protein